MTRYAWSAVAPDGSVAEGVQTARTQAEARLALAERQLRVTRLEERRGRFDVELTAARLRRTDLMHLSRQLGAFIRAGIPILDAIGTLAEESDRTAVRRVMTAVGRDLRTGSTLSEAVDRHPDDFPVWYRGILHSAELTGRLDVVLDQLAGYLERDIEARRKVKSAMIYPSIVALMAVGTVLVLSLAVLPKFEDFFASLDAELPLATRMLLATTRFLGDWWQVISAALALLVVGAALLLRIPPVRLFWHRTLLDVWVIGQAIRYASIERFTRLLASMVGAGVPLPEAMQVATDSLGNRAFRQALSTARAQMMQGAGLARPIAATRLFPGVAAQMIRVGEDTGTIDTQLEVAAAHYERELDYKLAKIVTIIEPLVIVLMGGVVGFVAIALVSAMYGIFRTAHLS